MTSKSLRRERPSEIKWPWPCMNRVETMCIIGHDHNDVCCSWNWCLFCASLLDEMAMGSIGFLKWFDCNMLSCFDLTNLTFDLDEVTLFGSSKPSVRLFDLPSEWTALKKYTTPNDQANVRQHAKMMALHWNDLKRCFCGSATFADRVGDEGNTCRWGELRRILMTVVNAPFDRIAASKTGHY